MRKATAPAPEEVPLPESPKPVTPLPISSTTPRESHSQIQLRTPSPSLHSVAHGAHHSGSPAPNPSPLGSTRSGSPYRQPIIHKPLETLNVAEATPESLYAFLSIIPPKILHSYTLSHVPSASEEVIKSLASFFDTLTPPPRLHCVRCHKDYVEIENEDRSCLVPHDDNSAEVERVGLSANRDGAGFETLWGCCGKTTEGDGSQGPPDGWCYEGKHTTDAKRARFRADSTLQSDKLVSCLKLDCHGIRATMPRSSRKRRRSPIKFKEASSEDDGSDGEADSGMEEMAGKSASVKSKGKSVKGKAKAKAADDDKMDVDQPAAPEHNAESVSPVKPPAKRRGRPPKSKVATEDKDEAKDKGNDDDDDASSVKSAPKRRGRPPKPKPIADQQPSNTTTDAPSSTTTSTKRTKARPPKSTASSANPRPSASPARTTRTRSQSRTRVSSMVNAIETAQPAPPVPPIPRNLRSSPSRTKIVPETEDEADERTPRKRRKVAS